MCACACVCVLLSLLYAHVCPQEPIICGRCVDVCVYVCIRVSSFMRLGIFLNTYLLFQY